MILLDTCAILWSTAGMLSASGLRNARAAAENGELFISPISFWEISTLARSRVDLGTSTEAYLDRVERSEIRITAVTPAIARVAGSFDEKFPGDPADRIIVATALALNLKLMTRDKAIRSVASSAGLHVLSC